MFIFNIKLLFRLLKGFHELSIGSADLQGILRWRPNDIWGSNWSPCHLSRSHTSLIFFSI